MILNNGILTVEVSEKGAEMVSVLKQGRQILWNANPDFWNRHAPILFPIVGKLRDDKCRFGARECSMKQHGFARDGRFVPTGNRGELKLAEKPSREVYPFDFDLPVHYELEGNLIKVIWNVINKGYDTMWFQIGGHPGFMLPSYDEKDAVHGYFRLYDADGKVTSPLLLSKLEDGLRVPLSTPKTMFTEELPITNKTFDQGAILIEEHQVAAVALLDKNHRPVLRVDCPQAEAFGLWETYKNGCPFLCIEPWCGIADSYDFTGDFSERKYVHGLAPKQTYEYKYSITIY